MAHEAAAKSAGHAQTLALPDDISSHTILRQVRRELEAVDEFVRQHDIREPGKQAVLPRVGRALQGLAEANGLQLLEAEHRKQLTDFLNAVETHAPRLQISFAVEATPTAMNRLIQWLRGNLHPQALLEVGLQPTIIAGCIVRTPNKVFDFSLRKRFADAEDLLVQSIEATAPPVAGSLINPGTAAAAPEVTAS